MMMTFSMVYHTPPPPRVPLLGASGRRSSKDAVGRPAGRAGTTIRRTGCWTMSPPPRSLSRTGPLLVAGQ